MNNLRRKMTTRPFRKSTSDMGHGEVTLSITIPQWRSTMRQPLSRCLALLPCLTDSLPSNIIGAPKLKSRERGESVPTPQVSIALGLHQLPLNLVVCIEEAMLDHSLFLETHKIKEGSESTWTLWCSQASSRANSSPRIKALCCKRIRLGSSKRDNFPQMWLLKFRV